MAPARTNANKKRVKQVTKKTDGTNSTACYFLRIRLLSPIRKTKVLTNSNEHPAARNTLVFFTPSSSFAFVDTQFFSCQQWLHPPHCWPHLSDMCGVTGSTMASRSPHNEQEEAKAALESIVAKNCTTSTIRGLALRFYYASLLTTSRSVADICTRN